MPVRIGYASGVYDLFHIGHLNLLRQARDRCDFLIAGVASAKLSKGVKGITPVVPLTERLEIVRGIRFVDDVVVDDHANKTETWRQVGFNIVFKGDDWHGTPKGDRLERDMELVGVEVVYLPYTATTSSTKLRRALALLADPPGDAALNA